MTRVGSRQLRDAVEIAWVCILQCEIDAAIALLDEKYTSGTGGEAGNYVLGRMGHHRIVITWPSVGSYGIAPIVRVATRIHHEFRNLRFCLLVGIAGGCPNPRDNVRDVRLGDVVVSTPEVNRGRGGVVQVDMGKQTDSGFEIYSHLNKPHADVLNVIPLLRNDHNYQGRRQMDGYIDEVARQGQTSPHLRQFTYPHNAPDRLFLSEHEHFPRNHPDCTNCDGTKVWARARRATTQPRVFYGTVGSANNVLRSAKERDRLHREEGILCVEMEAAGVMDTLSCLVVRGICDYADSHKNKAWQSYAALSAAAYTKELLTYVTRAPPSPVHGRHCLLGTVPVDEVDRALASRPDEFVQDVERLVGQMCDIQLHFFHERLVIFQQFLYKYGFRPASHWVEDGRHIYDGFNEERAAAVIKNMQKPPQERLRAARAYAFINANEFKYASTFTTHDTVLRIAEYVHSR